MTIPRIRFTNKASANARLREYPVDVWKAQAIDTTDPAFDDPEVDVILATRPDDYTIASASFITDLHRIAQILTDQEPDPGKGYVVRTTRRGLGEGQVGFRFYVVPRAQARGTSDRPARRAQLEEGHSAELLAAWEDHRRAAWFCATPSQVGPPHVIGYDPACPDCTGLQPVALPEAPTSGFVEAFKTQAASS